MAKSVNNFERGMILLDNKIKQPDNSYSYALNAIPGDEINDRSSIKKESGFETKIKLREGKYNILGNQWLGDSEYVFFIKHLEGSGTPFNEIWYVDIEKDIKTLKYSKTSLNFQDNHPIMSTYRTNYKNDRIIYFVDGLNDDRVINIDLEDTESLDISMLSINSSELKPTIKVDVSDLGGSVKTGQYFVAVSYKDENDYITDASDFSQPISISSDRYFKDEEVNLSNTRVYNLTNGDSPDAVSSKKLIISVDNVDSRYNKGIIYIVQVIDTDIKIYKTEDLFVLNNTLNFEFTGLNLPEDTSTSINDLIVGRINYYASQIINQKENRLIRGNSKIKESAIDYQEFANDIKVQYSIEEELVANPSITYNFTEPNFQGLNSRVPTSTRKTETADNYGITPEYLANTGNSLEFTSKSFMREEVYALGISFELSDGTETDVFHIPGRKVNSFVSNGNGTGEYDRNFAGQEGWETDLVFNFNKTQTTLDYRYKSENTAIKRSGKSELGFWESTMEYPENHNYPTDGNTGSNGRSLIRHHKMPSDVLEPIFRTEIVTSTDRKKEYKTYKRNIKLHVSNIVIPDKYKDVIVKAKIHYAKRDHSNKSIIAKGLLINTYNDNNQVRQSSQFNKYAQEPNSQFQFLSPEVDFNFKQFPISANKFKAGYVAKGYINYIGRRWIGMDYGQQNPTYNVYVVNLINNYIYEQNEGNAPYQKFLAGHCFYNEVTRPIKRDYYRPLDGAIFTDSNSLGASVNSTPLSSYNFSGEDNSSLVGIADIPNGAYLRNINIAATDYPQLNYEYAKSSNVLDTISYNQGIGSGMQQIYYDTVLYGSLIRDIPDQYGNPNDLIYYSTGTTIEVGNNSIIEAEVKNGDTYIDVHYTRKSFSDPNINPDAKGYWIARDGERSKDEEPAKKGPIGEDRLNSYMAYFVETDLNIRMRSTDKNKPDNFPDYWPVFIQKQGDLLHEYEMKATSPEHYYIPPYYNYNSLKEYYANKKTVKDFEENSVNNIRFQNRLIYSDKQDYENLTDNFRITRANNYKDLPMDRGQITHSFIKDDKFFVITRDALYNIYASNNTLQSVTGDNITVGTGEFFSMEPQEILSIKGGFGGTTSKHSLVESQFGTLYVDRLKNKVIVFNDNLADINILGLNENFKLELYESIKELSFVDGFDSPITGPGISSTFDHDVNRFIITKKDYKPTNKFLESYKGTFDVENNTYKEGDFVERNNVLYEITDTGITFKFKKVNYKDTCLFENKSFTVSFDPIRQCWISYHSYIPSVYINNNTSFYKFEDNNNLEEYGSNDLKCCYPFILETVFNEHPLLTKTFDSITVNCETNKDGIYIKDFFDTAVIYNENQSTGYLNLDSTVLTKKEKDWNINKILDITNYNNNLSLFSKNWEDLSQTYPIDKVLNINSIDTSKPWYQRGRMRDKYVVLRLINSNNLENSKIIVNFVSTTFRGSQR